MPIDYDSVAETYDRHRFGGGPYLDALVSAAKNFNAQRVLELGAGTGNNTAAFLEQHPCSIVALELSRGMLSKAAAKRLTARWVQGSALHIPLAKRSVDFVFACYVIHHIPRLATLMNECARVLNRGAAAFVTCSEAFIEGHPMNRYFPSFARIDRARFQPIREVADALDQAGFRNVQVQRVAAAPIPIDRHYADRVAGKFISTYALLPEAEFAAGLKRLYAEIEQRGQLDIPMVWESTVVSGERTRS